jgi:hypothetical protein
MIVSKKVKLVMSVGELTIRLKKGWVMSDHLVEQIGRPQQIGFRGTAKARAQEKIFRASVEIEGG